MILLVQLLIGNIYSHLYINIVSLVLFAVAMMGVSREVAVVYVFLLPATTHPFVNLNVSTLIYSMLLMLLLPQDALTSLHWAALRGDVAAISLLLQKGASITAKDKVP